MENIEVKQVTELMRACLRDMPPSLSELKPKLYVDIALLEERLLARGYPLIMSDLPKLGKIYDKSLEKGRIVDKLIPSSLRTAQDPEGIHGGANYRVTFLFDCLFKASFGAYSGQVDKPGLMFEGYVDPDVVFFSRTLFYMFKNLAVPCPKENILKAKDDFVSLDASLRKPSRNWQDPDNFFDSPLKWRYEEGVSQSTLSIAALLPAIIGYLLDDLPSGEIDLSCRHGSGSVADSSETGDKYPFTHWPARAESIAPSDKYVMGSWDEAKVVDRDWNKLFHGEVAAKLIAVPKTYDKPRLIASEPTSHMFLQQGLMVKMRSLMSSYSRACINFHKQELSQDLTIQASLESSDLATVDLSSASDRLSLWTIEHLFQRRPNWLLAMAKTRSLSIDVSDFYGEIVLRKFAPQGNALTFPVQSIVYLAMVTACQVWDMWNIIREKFSSEYSVLTDSLLHTILEHLNEEENREHLGIRIYGDDIICRSRLVPDLVELMKFFQLEVNTEKSFTDGPFRESCGMDAYRGYDVTPFYIRHLGLDRKFKNVGSWVEVSNNAHKKGLWNLAYAMRNAFEPSALKRLPASQNNLDSLHLYTFSNPVELTPIRATLDVNAEIIFKLDEIDFALDPGIVKRFNKSLGRPEYRAFYLDPKELMVRRAHGEESLLQYFVENRPKSNARHHLDEPTRWKAGYKPRGTATNEDNPSLFSLEKKWSRAY